MKIRPIFCLCLLMSLSAAPAAGQPTAVNQWPLETVVTRDGHTYRGLIRSATELEIEFVEVVRPRGKPMHLVIRPIAKNQIVRQQRLAESDRKLLARRVDQFRNRARIELGRMEDISLESVQRDGRVWQVYDGPWFVANSSADEETTRRAIVRVEQLFRAYRQLIPPRTEPGQRLNLLLLGSMDQYRTLLAKHELDVDNPAIYSQEANLIIAGSELTQFANRLRQARAQHDTLRKQYEQRGRDMPIRLAALRKELKTAGQAERAIDKELNARLAMWEAEYESVMSRLLAADRRNEARFAELTEQMFRSLAHEGLHAYVDNFVYPPNEFDVPVWLHEGLAQVFESGRLEADTLRIDAPSPLPLATIQTDLDSKQTLPLLVLLTTKRDDFLRPRDVEFSREQMYAHAWGLAYYLMFDRAVLGEASLTEFVARRADSPSAVKRFEDFTGEPLEAFEQGWQQSMKSLR